MYRQGRSSEGDMKDNMIRNTSRGRSVGLEAREPEPDFAPSVAEDLALGVPVTH